MNPNQPPAGQRTAVFRLSRLVWRDAARRYWVGLSVTCAPAAYLAREWPPWALRDALWRAGPWPWLGVAVAYVLLTLGPTRQLVASERLSYWRQLPISPLRWRSFHAVHLLLLHGPALGALAYALVPAGPFVAVGGPLAVALVTIAPLAWRLGHPVAERRTWSLRLPRPRTPTMALARVLLLALTRRRLAAFVGVVATSLILALLGWVATSHVLEAGEPGRRGPARRAAEADRPDGDRILKTQSTHRTALCIRGEHVVTRGPVLAARSVARET